MRKILPMVMVLTFSLPAAATKAVTTSTVQRPQTTVQAIHQTPTNAIVTKPATSVAVSRPTTTVVVTRPTTVPSTSTAFGGVMGKNAAEGSYTPSYKNAKTLAPSSVQTPAAAALGKGEKGLGNKETQGAQKDAAAAKEKPKAESTDLASVMAAIKNAGGVDKKMLENKNQAAAMYNKNHKK